MPRPAVRGGGDHGLVRVPCGTALEDRLRSGVPVLPDRLRPSSKHWATTASERLQGVSNKRETRNCFPKLRAVSERLRRPVMANIAKRPDGRWRARYRDESGSEHARHF